MGKALKQTLQKAQKMGRRGDKILAHITPEEARLLKARGGAGTRNPQTGLPEFWMDDDDDDGWDGDTGGYTSNGDGSYSHSTNTTGSFTGGGGTQYNTQTTYGDRDSSTPVTVGTGTDLHGNQTSSNSSSGVTYTSSSSSDSNNQTTATAAAPAAPPATIESVLKSWGGTDEQIQAIVDSLGDDVDKASIIQQLQEVPQEDRIVYLIDNYGDVVQEWGSGPGAVPLNDATRGAQLQMTPEERLQAAVDAQVMGTSTGEGLTDNGDGTFTDPTSGDVFYQTEDGSIVDRDGNVRPDPGTGLAAQIKDFQDKESGLANQLYGKDGITDQIKGLNTEYGTFVDNSITAMNAPENDFASQIGGHINNFLNGYTAADGTQHKGFLDYQSDLMDAGKTYKQDTQTLKANYDKTYGDYSKELDPLRGQMSGVNTKLGQVADQQMGVARDAGSQNYYNKLSDLYYSQAQDSIQAGAQGAKAALNESYANAGMNPNSPAFTKAMMDLSQSKADAMVNARRQSVLDSYGLGSQMLQNRSSALGNAGAALSNQMSGIGAEMGAVDSLYGVQLAGLGTRNDMIGQIYGIDSTNAQTGMQGASTVLEANLNKVNTKSNQFYKNMDTTNSLYGAQGNMLNNTANALGAGVSYYGGKGDQAFNTMLEANQGNKSDVFSFGTLQQMYEKEGIEMPEFVRNNLPG